MQTHGVLAMALLLGIYALAELRYSLAAPLWHDELFTFYIAQAPSTRAMLEWSRRVDLNPPLSYLLTRASFKLFGVGTLQCRLPEIGGFALALAGIFAFLKRRAGAAYGVFAAALLFGSRAGELVFQARPYGLMLGTGAVALACWQAASSPSRRTARMAEVGLFLSLTALLLTHIFGLLLWAALFVAEAAQSMQQRRVQAARLAALLLPLLATLSYLPLLRSHAQAFYPAAFQPSPSDIFIFYMGHIDREIVCLLLSSFVLLLVGAGDRASGGDTAPVFSKPEWVAVGCLLAAPLLLIAHLMLAHEAFFDRYGVTVCLGTAALCSALWYRWTGARTGPALIAAVIALLITGRLPDAILAVTHGRVFRYTEPLVKPLDTALLTQPALPLVTASGLTFLEMQRREPESLLQRTVYLTDRTASIQYAHATIFDGMQQEVRLFALHRHVEPFAQFTAAHPVFYVLGTYDYPEDWLLRKLQADRAQLQVLGRVEGSYKDHELYLVHLQEPSPSRPIPSLQSAPPLR